VTPAIIDNSLADYHFYKLGLHYYASGRFAFFSAMIPVAGNLLHHAVEMVLKGRLTHSLSLVRLKRKYSHDLCKTWRRFKKCFATCDLSGDDNLVTGLHEFETLRYPDDLLEHGAHIGFTLQANPQPIHSAIPGQPVYQLSLADVDSFMDRLFTLCSISVATYAQGLMERGKQMLIQQNASASSWFAS